MATNTEKSEPERKQPALEPAFKMPPIETLNRRLRVSPYDNAASMLLALTMIVGFFVVLTFIVWLTTVLTFGTQAVEVQLVEEYAGRGDHAKGYARDPEEPGLEELEEPPQLEATVEAVTDAASSVAASLYALNTDALVPGKGSDLGDSRTAGLGGEGEDMIPRWERWHIRYASDSLARYSRQLDFFGIELGAAGGGIKHVDYAKGLSGRIQKRQGASNAEQRLYFTWTSGALRDADCQLLTRAGIPLQRRVMMQFYPKKTENNLEALEKAACDAEGKTVNDVRRTVFGVKELAGGRFEYYVIDQLYRW